MRYSILLLVPLVGCANQWRHPTATAAQFHNDRYECTIQANAMYPVAMASTTTSYQAPSTTRCTGFGNTTSCTTTPGYQAPTYQYDANATQRNGFVSDCLKARGYKR